MIGWRLGEDGSWLERNTPEPSPITFEQNPGNTVSNMSSTRALRQVTEARRRTRQAQWARSRGEGHQRHRCDHRRRRQRGHHLPCSHSGVMPWWKALFLTQLAESGQRVSALRSTYPNWFMSKGKLALPAVDVDAALMQLMEAHPEAEVNTVDGVKFDLEEGWVHLRKSNTEPIIRVYAEASSLEAASALGDRFKNELQGFLRALED